MKPELYPPQEPLSANGKVYHDRVMGLGATGGIPGEEHRYGDDPYQSLIVHPAAGEARPLLIFLHGGGWTSGYKEWMIFMAPAFVAAGVGFASIGYRLAPRHLFPAGVEDVIGGLRWLYDHATDLRLDRTRFYLGGHSAGGHYAALLAVRRDWQRPAGLPQGIVRGCMPISGVYDFGPESGLGQRPRFLGPDGNGNELSASPIGKIAGTPPPFLMAHGERDFPHLMRQAERMEIALRAAGGPVERMILPGCDHFGASYIASDPDGPWLPKALSWLDRY